MRYPVIDMQATGARIRELRIKNCLTIDQVRDFMGLESEQAICKWQSGKALPKVDNLYAMARLFGVRIEDILVEVPYEYEEDEMSSSFILPQFTIACPAYLY